MKFSLLAYLFLSSLSLCSQVAPAGSEAGRKEVFGQPKLVTQQHYYLSKSDKMKRSREKKFHYSADGILLKFEHKGRYLWKRHKSVTEYEIKRNATGQPIAKFKIGKHGLKDMVWKRTYNDTGQLTSQICYVTYHHGCGNTGGAFYSECGNDSLRYTYTYPEDGTKPATTHWRMQAGDWVASKNYKSDTSHFKGYVEVKPNILVKANEEDKRAAINLKKDIDKASMVLTLDDNQSWILKEEYKYGKLVSRISRTIRYY